VAETRRIRRRRWTGAEDNLLRSEYGTKSAAALGALMDRTEDAVWLRARILGLEKREEHRPWTDTDLDEVRRCYPHERCAVIARRLGRTAVAVSQKAALLGVISHDALIGQSAVHDYFSEVRTAEQAYILGLLAADGNVSSTHPRVTLGLQAKDAHLVEWVRDRLNPLANLYRRPDGFTSMLITSAPMVADLAQFGIVPRKSRTLGWPVQLGELQRPFLLGYFDGDGSMYLPRDRHSRERPGWTVCSGSEQFLIDMRAYILAATGVGLQKIQHRRGADLWQVAITGRGAAVIDEWLHRDGLGLARKRFPERVLARYRGASPGQWIYPRPGLAVT
jgi:hypothetical protein